MSHPTILIILAAFVTLIVAYQPRQTNTVDLASASADKFIDNFHAQERGYRWTQARSAVWLSGLGGGNLEWTLGMRLSGSRPAGMPAPQVRLHVNGQPLAEFIASNEERDVEFALEPGRLGLNGDLLLEMDADTFTPRSDPRELGVRVMSVWATPAEGFALPSAKVVGLMFGILIACVLSICVVDYRFQISDSEAAPLWGFRLKNLKSEIYNLKFLLGVFWLASAAALLFNRAEAAWWIGVVFLIATGLAALVMLIAWIVPRGSLSERQWRVLLAVFALAALGRLILDTGRGYEGDVAIYLSLAWKSVTLGIHSTYLHVSDVPPPNTPPFLLYPFWITGWLYQQFFSPLFPPTWLNDPPILRFMLRLPSLAADLLIGAIIFRATLSAHSSTTLHPLAGTGDGWAASHFTVHRSLFTVHYLLPTAFYFFNPAIIFDSAYWGQTAAIHSLWMLLAIVAITRAAYGWAGAALCLAALTKPQALAIAPIILFVTWRERRLLRLTLAAAATWLLANAPFVVTGNVESVLGQYAQTASYHPFISVNAHNLWWFITGGQGWQPDSLSLVGPLSFRLAGLLLFGLATLLSLALLWRDRRALFTAAAYQSLAFFMLLTQIHENHLLPMFAPLAIACALDRKGWWLYGAFALTVLANMALHDPNLVAALGYPLEDIYGGPGLALPRWINAAMQTFLFGLFTLRMLIKLKRDNGLIRDEQTHS